MRRRVKEETTTNASLHPLAIIEWFEYKRRIKQLESIGADSKAYFDNFNEYTSLTVQRELKLEQGIGEFFATVVLRPINGFLGILYNILDVVKKYIAVAFLYSVWCFYRYYNGGSVESELFSKGIKSAIIPFAVFALWYFLGKTTDWLYDKIDYLCE